MIPSEIQWEVNVLYVNNVFSLPHTKVTIHNVQYDFIIDTGAVSCILTPYVYKSLDQTKITPYGGEVRSANGTPITVEGQIGIHLVINGKQYTHVFICAHVMRNIIGYDFLKTHHLAYDAASNTLIDTSKTLLNHCTVTVNPKTNLSPLKERDVVFPTVISKLLATTDTSDTDVLDISSSHIKNKSAQQRPTSEFLSCLSNEIASVEHHPQAQACCNAKVGRHYKRQRAVAIKCIKSSIKSKSNFKNHHHN